MDLRSVTAGELAEMRRQNIAARLTGLQEAVSTAERTLQAAEADEPKAAAALAESEQKLQKQLDKTRQALEKAGVGIDPEKAAVAPAAAEHEFEFRVRNAAPCKAAQAAVDDASNALKAVRAAVRNSRDGLQTAEHRLQGFVDRLLQIE